MDQDFDMGNDIKDDLIPLALEYYLGVIEKADSDGEEEDEDEDEDDGPKPKKAGKKQGKVAPGAGPKGPNGEASPKAPSAKQSILPSTSKTVCFCRPSDMTPPLGHLSHG